MNEELIKTLEEKLVKEIEFHSNDNISLAKKREQMTISLGINKLINSVIQIEALKQRTKENEIKIEENTRLVERFSK